MTNIQKQENRAVSPVNQMKNLLANQGIQNLFADALNENKDRFLASIIDLYNGDTYLQGCNPKEVAMEALKAATLNLPINKSLGYAYIVPFKNKANAVYNTLYGEISEKCPASILRKKENSCLYLDPESAERINL